MKKAFIFDFDGTIADTIPSDKKIVEMFNEFAQKEKLPQRISIEDVVRFREEHLYTAIKMLKIPLWRIPFLVKKLQKTLRQDITVAQPIAQIEEVLRELKKQGIVLGIISSSPKETIQAFIKHYKLEVFDFIHSASNLFGKHTVIKKVLKNNKLNPLDILYVGDEIRDIDATKKAGVPMVAVTWGFNSKEGLKKHAPFQVIDTPKELLSKKLMQ